MAREGRMTVPAKTGPDKKEANKTKPNKKKQWYFDYYFLAVLILLICFGAIMLYSTTAYNSLIDEGDSFSVLKKHLIFCAAGFVGMFIISMIDYHIYAKYVWYIYILSFISMALVRTKLGVTINGARRWIGLPRGYTIQPSEFAKIAIILLIPALVCKAGKTIQDSKKLFNKNFVLIFGWGILLAIGVWQLTDNLSTGIIVAGICAFILFVAYYDVRWFVAGFCLAMVAYVACRNFLSESMVNSKNFRLRRIAVWLSPEHYAKKEGYQIMQGLYALGSGGFWGKGLGNSAQKLLIPEPQNDMILSIICEELGVVGAIVILILFALLLYHIMVTAQNAPDLYGSLIATGVFAHVAIQVVLNFAVITNTIPTTGITLPFFSYGGTSFLFLMAEMGLVLGISRQIYVEQ